MPLTLKITGNYFEIEQFLNELEGVNRAFLVTGYTLTAGEDSASGTGGAPATSASPAGADGDLTLDLTGRVFLSPELSTASAATSNSAAAPATAQAN